MEERFCRNIPALSQREQALLRRRHVCVVGCGGLGGYLVEYMARVGVGTLTVIDGDRFDTSNLNRQLLSSPAVLGTSKAEAAARRIAEIDPDISVCTHTVFLTPENAAALLDGADLALDALDSGDARKILSDACRARHIPLVHGAVQGWNAQVAVCMPEDRTLEQLCPPGMQSADKSCLSFTPALCAAIQAAEAVKLLTGRAPSLKSRLLFADLRDMDFETIELS